VWSDLPVPIIPVKSGRETMARREPGVE